jgi:hypothetical protein
MKLGEDIAHMGETRNVVTFWLENMKGREHVEDLGVDGRIILECVLEKQVAQVRDKW